jgi:hypothetical protein
MSMAVYVDNRLHWLRSGWSMRKLDLEIGDVVEVDGLHYKVVPDGAGGVAFEPAIKRRSELPKAHGAPPASEIFRVDAGALRNLLATLGRPAAHRPGLVDLFARPRPE